MDLLDIRIGSNLSGRQNDSRMCSDGVSEGEVKISRSCMRPTILASLRVHFRDGPAEKINFGDIFPVNAPLKKPAGRRGTELDTVLFLCDFLAAFALAGIFITPAG